jgi:hypothetical protein
MHILIHTCVHTRVHTFARACTHTDGSHQLEIMLIHHPSISYLQTYTHTHTHTYTHIQRSFVHSLLIISSGGYTATTAQHTYLRSRIHTYTHSFMHSLGIISSGVYTDITAQHHIHTHIHTYTHIHAALCARCGSYQAEATLHRQYHIHTYIHTYIHTRSFARSLSIISSGGYTA